ncbi:rhomboid family intramembrane serine protease [bacterium]|nr:rhomboid family intramembrane serine protease [bacterium]
MRKIGSVRSLEMAHTFSDYLASLDIENQVRTEESFFEIWVLNDSQLDLATSELNQYIFNPFDEKYLKSKGAARALEKTQAKEQRQYEKEVKDLRRSLAVSNRSWGPITITFIGISVLVALVSQLGRNTDPVSFLYITNFEKAGRYISYSTQLSQYLGFDFYRLFTPIFLHFGILHLVFNMMWLKDLGSIIEKHHGSLYYIILMLVIAGASNLAQFLVSGPSFGGMSGVVYGLLGFLWIRGKCDPYYHIILNKQVVVMMIVWFFVCLTGLLGPVANTVHGVGLAMGMLWGYLSSGQIIKRHK